MRTDFMLMAIYNKPRLNFEEVCNALGIAPTTGYTRRSLGTFPVPMTGKGKNMSADIRDVANALDELRREAHHAMASLCGTEDWKRSGTFKQKLM